MLETWQGKTESNCKSGLSVSSVCRSKLQKTAEFCIVRGSGEVAVTTGLHILVSVLVAAKAMC